MEREGKWPLNPNRKTSTWREPVTQVREGKTIKGAGREEKRVTCQY